MAEIINLTVLQVNQYALTEPTVQSVPVSVVASPVDILVNGVQANSLVEVPPSGLNQLSQNLLVVETVSQIANLANGGTTTTTTSAPTTTTTTVAVAPTEYNRPYYLNENNACNSTTDGSITFYSTASPNLNLGANNDGKTVFTNIELTVPVTQGYVLTFGNPMFPAKYTVLAGGVLQATVCP